MRAWVADPWVDFDHRRGAHGSVLTVIVLLTFFLPAAVQGQAVGSKPGPLFEIAGAIGVGTLRADESSRGNGPSVGGTVGARLTHRFGVDFAVDHLRTRRDFESDVHWRNDSTLFTGNVSCYFSASRGQPFVAGAFGAARLHSWRSNPPYQPLPGPPFVVRGPDEVFEDTSTQMVWGVGSGVKFSAKSLQESPEFKMFVVPDSTQFLWLVGLRMGYGFGSEPRQPAACSTRTIAPSPDQRTTHRPPVGLRSSPILVRLDPSRTAEARKHRVAPLGQSFQDLVRTLKVGQSVFVIDKSGEERNGKVGDVFASSFTLVEVDSVWDTLSIGLAAGAVGGAVVGYESHTWRWLPVGAGIGAITALVIDRATKGPKGKWTFAESTVTEVRAIDRLLNGALIGAGIGAGLGLADYMRDPSEPGNASITAATIGLGAALGLGIDRLVSKRGKVLYAAPRQRVADLPVLACARLPTARNASGCFRH